MCACQVHESQVLCPNLIKSEVCLYEEKHVKCIHVIHVCVVWWHVYVVL